MAPTSRITAPRLGKIPTTSVRRRISLFNRPAGYWSGFSASARGKAVKAKCRRRRRAYRPPRRRTGPVSLSITSPELGPGRVAVGLLEDRADQVAIIGQLALGTREARLAMKWVRQRCQDASAKTAAMAALIPPWASEMTSSTPRAPGPPGRRGRPPVSSVVTTSSRRSRGVPRRWSPWRYHGVDHPAASRTRWVRRLSTVAVGALIERALPDSVPVASSSAAMRDRLESRRSPWPDQERAVQRGAPTTARWNRTGRSRSSTFGNHRRTSTPSGPPSCRSWANSGLPSVRQWWRRCTTSSRDNRLMG